jgi:hypothetical protein
VTAAARTRLISLRVAAPRSRSFMPVLGAGSQPGDAGRRDADG